MKINKPEEVNKKLRRNLAIGGILFGTPGALIARWLTNRRKK